MRGCISSRLGSMMSYKATTAILQPRQAGMPAPDWAVRTARSWPAPFRPASFSFRRRRLPACRKRGDMNINHAAVHHPTTASDQPFFDPAAYGNRPGDAVTDSTENAAVTHHSTTIGQRLYNY